MANTSKYNDTHPKRAKRLCLLGLGDNELAIAFGVSPATILYWRRTQPEFEEGVQAGKTEADGHVAEALYKRALGYSHPDVHIMANRVKEYDADGRLIKEYNEPLIIPITKHYPPDSWAANKWLSIRQRTRWSESQTVNHVHSGRINMHQITGANDLQGFSMDELKMLKDVGLKLRLQENHDDN